jgi:hypothetical protein
VLGLPQLADGAEERPGLWGLRTPGYYIFALHFRNVPLGFEPLSAEINERADQREFRKNILGAFWAAAEKNAVKAKVNRLEA